MFSEKGSIKLTGLILVGALIIAPFVLAHIDRVNPGINVTVTDNNQSFSAVIVGDSNGSVLTCVETDGGFGHLSDGNITATFSDRNGTFVYVDKCMDGNTLLEYACGANIQVNGQTFSNSAFAFSFNCGSIGKVCSLGKCV